MLEALRRVADDLVRDAADVHPALEYREIVIGFRTLAAGIGRQYEVEGPAARDPLDDHRRAVASHTPRGDDRRAWQRRIGRTARASPDPSRGAGEHGRHTSRSGSST